MTARKPSPLEELAAVGLFDQCTGRELARIDGLTTVVALPADRPVCGQGEFGRQFFIVREGTFDVDRDGERITALHAGDWFGEIALNLRCARVASVTSSTPASLFVFSAREYWSMRSACPDIANGIDAAMHERLHELRAMSLVPPAFVAAGAYRTDDS